MNEKVLDNGKVIKTENGNPKEIANSIIKDYKENPKIDINSEKATSDKISEQKLNGLKSNNLYNQINSHVEKDEDNKLDKLNNMDKATSKDIANKIHEDRSKKLPKSNLNLL